MAIIYQGCFAIAECEASDVENVISDVMRYYGGSYSDYSFVIL
jgi:hypothetical protein